MRLSVLICWLLSAVSVDWSIVWHETLCMSTVLMSGWHSTTTTSYNTLIRIVNKRVKDYILVDIGTVSGLQYIIVTVVTLSTFNSKLRDEITLAYVFYLLEIWLLICWLLSVIGLYVILDVPVDWSIVWLDILPRTFIIAVSGWNSTTILRCIIHNM